MGTIIKAICKCGFESENIFAGGGFVSFRTTCIAPAVCVHCAKFLVLNYIEKDPECPECGKKVTFYDDPSVQKQRKDPGGKDIFSWNTNSKGVFRLPDTSYLCPKCGKMGLKFTLVGLWD